MSQAFDIIVIGAGIVGAGAAAALGATHRVVLVEAEEQAGYHTTGRSAAIWIRNYGPPDVRVLTGLSRDFFLAPPEDIGTDHLAVGRKVIYLAPPEQTQALDTLIGQRLGIEEISLAEAKRQVPALIEGYAVRAGLESDAFDMDVAATSPVLSAARPAGRRGFAPAQPGGADRAQRRQLACRDDQRRGRDGAGRDQRGRSLGR